MNSFTRLLLAGALGMAGVTSIDAAPITYSLSGVTFSDGATATGSFTFDDVMNTISDYSITTSSGFFGFDFATPGTANPVVAYTYEPADAVAIYSPGQVVFQQSSLSLSFELRRLELDFSSLGSGTVPLTPGGLSDTGMNTGSRESDPVVGRFVNRGGSLVAGDSAVPEPASWALMLVGFGAMGHAMRRRKVAGSFA